MDNQYVPPAEEKNSMPPDNNGWNEYKRFVLKGLEDNAEAHDRIQREIKEANREVITELRELKKDITARIDTVKEDTQEDISLLKTGQAVLQTKAGIFGILGGVIVTAMGLLTKILNFW